MIIKFKSITMTKGNMHAINYSIEEQKGDAVIKSTVKIVLEDVEILPSEPLESIIEKAADIAKREYQSR